MKQATRHSGAQSNNLTGTTLPISLSTQRKIKADVYKRFGLRPSFVYPDGTTLPGEADNLRSVTAIARLRAHALAESVRWGEPYVFLLADGILSWLVALVKGEKIVGGICGGEVATLESPPNITAAATGLAERDGEYKMLLRSFEKLPTWEQCRSRQAAQYLYDTTYAMLGWRPDLLQRNRANALQQRQIAETIHQTKGSLGDLWPAQEEQQLLMLIKAGDRAGARKRLNELLAAMFLDSPRLIVLKARILELLGYLVRVAIENTPDTVSLMSTHRQWMVRLIEASDFETLCSTVRDTLDDFMDQVARQVVSQGHLLIRRALAAIDAAIPGAVTLEQVSKATGINRFRMSRLFKQRTGLTFAQHVSERRVAYARNLLATTKRSCAAIAGEAGFTDQSHLTRVFRAATGTTPLAYRRAWLQNRNPTVKTT